MSARARGSSDGSRWHPHLIKTMLAKENGAVSLWVLALTFSYAAVAALVPASVPQALMVRTAIWAAAVLIGYASYARRTGRSLAAAWAFPRTWWSLPLAVIAAATVGSAMALPSPDRTLIDLVRIMVVAVIGEEMLFRGLVWDVVRTAAQRTARRPDRVTLVVTSVLFAVSHLQYHSFQLTAALLGQIGYTLAAAVVLGLARARTGGVITPILLHSTGNAFLKLIEPLI